MTNSDLRVERCEGADGFGFWMIADGAIDHHVGPLLAGWIRSADAIFTARPEIASVSVVEAGSPLFAIDSRLDCAAGPAALARTAALPLCFVNGRVADLLGAADTAAKQIPVTTLQAWIERATLKGLGHVWVTTDALPGGLRPSAVRTVPSLAADSPVTAPWRSLPDLSARPAPIALGIDAAWLLGGESGAQVFAFELTRELACRDEIERIVFLSDTGGIPQRLAGVQKIGGASWADVAGGKVARLDILHRPYQPGTDVDYRRYYAAADSVAITVLDFIAYDNPAYHESTDAWRQYRRLFDEQVGLADGVFAISEHVGARLQAQFAHRLAGSVRSVLLGTDHLDVGVAPSRRDMTGLFAGLEERRFLLVLGNDFEHKNRDFAVRVFEEMCSRGYAGRLVLAGFHLDGGSTYSHELTGDATIDSRIVRTGSVSREEKAWLLGHAQAVLYPTSSEGFGLIPFEAAALGTPTAFVSFGPLRETLAGVEACGGWQIHAFADHVFSLIANPTSQVEQIRRAAASLTWRRCADGMLAGYRQLLRDESPWQTRREVLVSPGLWARMTDHAGKYAYRVRRKLRRLAAES